MEPVSNPGPGLSGPQGELPGLGAVLRRLRTARGWTLAEASSATGLARSSLSKVENGQMSPTYDLLLKLARGYGVDVAELFAPGAAPAAAGRMAVTRAGDGQRHQAPLYTHDVLAATLKHKKMMPFLTRIEPGSPPPRDRWATHAGEEFLYVLSGTVTFYTEHYEPVALAPGDSLYIDSAMPHACVADGNVAAEVLWVSAP